MPAPLPQRRPAPDPGDDLVRVSASALIALRHAAEGLPLRSPRRLGSMAGPHLSAFKGRGMEFEETRPYQPGDDVRSLHWRVTARTGRPHTKLFREERERPVWLLVDIGPTMRFGTRVAFKSVIAAQADPRRTASWSDWPAARPESRPARKLSPAPVGFSAVTG